MNGFGVHKVNLLLAILSSIVLTLGNSFVSRADIILQEAFNSGSLPAGWSNNIIQGAQGWSFQNAPAFGSTSGTFYTVFDDAALGAATIPNEASLQMPSLDCSGRTAVYLNYLHHWYGVESTHGYVEISNDGGTVWNTLMDYEKLTRGSLAAPQDTTLNISAFAANQSDVRIRFRYTDGSLAGQYWYIDDITVYSDSDVGPTDLVAPGYLGCSSSYSAAETVTVEITNHGFLPVSNVPITCNVTGGTTATLTGTLAGPIAPGATMNFTFASTIDMSLEAIYYFEIYTTLSTDEYLANDTLYTSRQQVISTYPYAMDFNGTDGGWFATGQSPPANGGRNFYHGPVPYLNGPQGQGDSWYVQTTSSNNGTFIWVESPIFNFTGLTDPQLFVDLKHSLHNSDYFHVEYSLNGGTTWTQLGTNANPDWYNGVNWWQNSYTNPVDEWTTYQKSLCALAGQPCVKLRFYGRPYYSAPTYTAYHFFAFDNVKIIDGPDVGITAYIDPVNIGCLFASNQVVTVEVYNYSCSPVSNVPVTCEITGAVTTTLTGTVPGPIPSESSVTYTFPGTFNMTTLGIYNFNTYTAYPGDVYLNNDTLATSIDVNQLLVNTYPYFEDFNSGPAYWIPSGDNPPGNNGRNFVLGNVPYLGGPL
ncbi:MAG: choice-of-anchor J domain-containing protein, partial [Crocinitomicaceae bacterium]|nr:choice-of-anchor J domain-containing protein [Crocinitomicaceae bacterium]